MHHISTFFRWLEIKGNTAQQSHILNVAQHRFCDRRGVGEAYGKQKGGKMPSLSLISWVDHLADVMLAVYCGQNYWDWTEKGARLKNLLESGIVKWFQARADAEIEVEVAALYNFLIKILLIIVLTWNFLK